MVLDEFSEWRGAFVALSVARAVGVLGRLLRLPRLATCGAAVGVGAGWVLVLGALVASPRQLPERLPLLATTAAVAGALLAAAADHRRVAWLGALLGVLAGAWWLAGAPLVGADLRRAAIPLLGLGALAAMLLLALDGPGPAMIAAAALCAALALAAPFGPWLVLGVALFAAILGGIAGGVAWPPGARLAPALALAALAAGPVLARGAAVDWLAAAAAPAALWFGPALAARWGGGRAAMAGGWAVAAAVPLLFLLLLTRLGAGR